MRVPLLLLTMVVFLPAGPVRAGDAIAIQKEMARLDKEVKERLKEENWDGALAAIRETLQLDADHPLPYRLAMDMLRRRKDLSGASALLATLGPPDGPGRHYGQGVALLMGERADEAGDAFSRALELYEQRRHPAGQAAGHAALGILERRAGRLGAALAHYAAAQAHLELIEDHLGLADVAAEQAKIERLEGRPIVAAERQRQVLAIRERLGDTEGQARSWHEIGACLLEGGDLPGARTALERALELRRTFSDKVAEGSTLRVLAEVEEASGNDRGALGHLVAAEAAFSRTKNQGTRAETLGEVGKTLRRLGEFERARTTLESARAMAAPLKDRKLEAGLLAHLGYVAGELRDFPVALAATEQSLALRRELKDTKGEIACLDTLVGLHHDMGDLGSARRHLESRHAVADRLDDPVVRALGHENMGVVLGESGEIPAAFEELGRAEKLWRDLGLEGRLAHLQCNRAELLAGQGQSDQARGLLEQALATFRGRRDNPGQALALNQLGALEAARGRHVDAMNRHTAALDLARRQGLAEEEWRARIGLAASMQEQGRHPEAVDHALRAIDKVESVRARLLGDAFKMRFLAGRMDLYERAISIILESKGGKGGDAERALEVVERAKARGLLDLLGESRHRMRDGLPGALKDREQSALDAVSAATVRLISAKDDSEALPARDALDRAEQDLARLELDIREAAPGYARIAFPRPASVKDVQAALGRDEMLLEYFTGEDSAWVWQVTKAGVSVHELPPPAGLRDAVSAFVKAAGSPGAAMAGDRKDTAARRLAGMILPPRRGLPSGRLLVAPDGPLHHVAFDALVVGDRYLIEEREVVTAPSATALLWMRSAAPSAATRAFLGVGGAPAGSDPSLALPWARQEVERIAGLFDEASRRVMLGDDVSRAALTEAPLRDFKYLHFATHGLLAEGAGGQGRTGLWLGRAPGQQADAILTLPEVSTLRLDADLVVLSACRSGEGELLDGEGLVGLTRAFLHAGARSVVMTLWNVSDQSTVDLMETFYRRLGSGAGPAAALRQAKLEFIRSDRPARREPYRWAPFVLVGASDR